MKNGWIFDSELFSHNQRVCSLAFLPITVNIGPWFVRFVIPIGSMYAIYGNIYHQYTPFMLAYIYTHHTWIVWDWGFHIAMHPTVFRLGKIIPLKSF